MPGMAITDRGNMYGIMEFHHVVKRINKERFSNGEEPFKPIFGCEVYVARRGDKLRKVTREDLGGYHLILLAKNYTGYKNLMRLVSNSWVEGYYSRPRTDCVELEKYHEGLIVLSGCVAGEVPSKIIRGDMAGARKAIEWFKSIWGDDYYLELQRHEVKDPAIMANRDTYPLQEQANKVIIELAKEYGVKLVCTNDVHFVELEQAEAHDRFKCMGLGKEINDPSRMLYTKQEWFKTYDEMKEVFSDIPEALSNTMEIFNKVELYSIERQPTLPLFPIPQGFISEYDYLKSLTLSGAHRIFGDSLPSEVEERLMFELEVIKSKGFSRLFLIIQDLVNAMRNGDVMVGPGHGVEAGSLVFYCLGITTIDPLKHDLLFESFIRLNHDMLPYFYIDFDCEGRIQAIEYLEEKYGKDCCAHIIMFTKIKKQKAIKEVALIEILPIYDSNAICKAIPKEYYYFPLKSIIQYVPKLKEAETSDSRHLSDTIKYSILLDNTICGTYIHPYGFVVSDGPISEWAPVSLEKDPNEDYQTIVCTQYESRYIGSSGFFQMNFVELRPLSEIKVTLSNIKNNLGIEIDLEHIPIDDPKTLKLFQKGNTIGVFLFELHDMRAWLKHLRPTTFDDLIAIYALCRPGAQDYISTFIRRKNGKEEINYDIPCMEKFLKETYGVTIYQEQIMLLSRQLADFSREESYILQDAMGKIKWDIIDALEQKFIKGGKKNGHDPKVLKKIWSFWKGFGRYTLMKSHAVSYTMIAYQTAYLKANYPFEYMTTLLESRKDNKVEYDLLLEECMRMKLYRVFKDYF